MTDSQLGTATEALAVANTLLSEMQKLTPSIKGTIPVEQFFRFNLQSGDILIITQPEKNLNGFFRVMELKATKKKCNVALESITTAIVRQRSRSLTDTISTILSKLSDSNLDSS